MKKNMKLISIERKSKKGLNALVNFKKVYRKLILTFLMSVLSLVFIFPIVLTLTNSFMTQGEINENYKAIVQRSEDQTESKSQKAHINLKLIPDEVVVQQYGEVLLKSSKFLLMFWNSVKLAVPIIIGQIFVASMAAYAFSRIHFRWREPLFFLYIITMLMPFQVTLVPNYIIADKLGLIGSYLSIIMPGIFGTFGVFLLRQFMVYIPQEYSEAARVDGANHFHIFMRIVLPMTKAGLAALAILVFIDNWNMVEQPVVFLQDQGKLPLSIFLSVINQGDMGVAFAASTLYMLPMLLVFLYGENYLIQGIQLSGIKG